MSEQATTPKLQFNQAVVVGRIQSMRTFEVQGKRTFETVVVQAAADQFSSPTKIAIQSHMKLGNAGDDIKTVVSVVGYGDSYKTREGEQITTARNVLRAVE